MSSLKRLFGKSPANQGPTIDQSINRLHETLSMLQKREDYLNKKIQGELTTIKQNAKNKRVALMALKRKKLYEGQVDKIANAIMTISEQLIAIEGATANLETLNAMRVGAQTMQRIHNRMTVEQVDNTMDEIRDQMDVAKEISDAISQPIGEVYDDDELLAELQEIEELQMEEELLSVSAPPVRQTAPTQPEKELFLPSVPTKQLTEEERELAELEASMAF
eukprot:CAMPEP_0184660822 /NCGR_PEP_ID=MMETSP0308-20130426/35420_1 /TAXON_ID=38269 /ORGANISM="Gloeochaete witrockiana, Strain SAG 46.84" /LENGTH=220 /DNA_ID=CAMNT_0027101685 /DNA_START=59 /DNA_END=721 /DNA_ORIENTATION=+